MFVYDRKLTILSFVLWAIMLFLILPINYTIGSNQCKDKHQCQNNTPIAKKDINSGQCDIIEGKGLEQHDKNNSLNKENKFHCHDVVDGTQGDLSVRSDIEKRSEIAKQNNERELVGKVLNTSVRLLSPGGVADVASSMISDITHQKLESWLNRFGTAKINLNLDNRFSLKESSLDWLYPWYDSSSLMYFSQFGLRNKDNRNTFNIGVGGRTFHDNWMYGVNTFYDNEFTGHNYRIGFGIEAWTDYLQLSANAYRRLNSWHPSRDFEDYDERPATGEDIRAIAYLPTLPQLGGKLIYEQYYGDHVALFGKDNLQRNPYAFTAGIDYTPVPLLTVGVDQRMGKSSKHETQLNLQMTYHPGEDFMSQLDPSAVESRRLLSTNRYNLVERHNNIVLDYQKQQVIKLTLSPNTIYGYSDSTYQITANVQSKYPLKQVFWHADTLISAGGKITPVDKTHFNLMLPPYKDGAQLLANAEIKNTPTNQPTNYYSISAVAVDQHGNNSNTSTLAVIVQRPKIMFRGKPHVIGDGALADGKAAITVEFTVIDSNDNPVVGKDVIITTTNSAQPAKVTVQTDVNGVARIMLTNTVPGTSVVTAEIEGQQQSVDTHFLKTRPDVNQSTLLAMPKDIIADGHTASTITLTLRDAEKRPIPGQDVSFDTTLGKIGAVTDHNDGTYSALLTGTTVGRATVSANVDGAAFGVPSVVINLTADPIPDVGRSHFTVSPTDIVADGKMSSSLTFIPVDKNGHFISGIKSIAFIQKGVAVDISAITEQAGSYIATVTGKTVGDVIIYPKVNNVELTALQQKIALHPVPEMTNILVNGSDFSTDKGFPKTIFKGAYFQLVMNGDAANNAQYDWSSSYAANAPVDNLGKVTFKYSTQGSQVTITAKSKMFPQYSVNYKFRPNLWVYDGGFSLVSRLEAIRICHASDFTDLIGSSRASKGVRAPDGTLWGEWGSLVPFGGWLTGEYWTKASSTDFRTLNMDTGAIQTPRGTSAYPLCAKVL
ncbi:inverse autotransporter beta domain-containing protein [Yersinia artesiana]|uniref:inverse autotransporter beta domain-containing protein n=1 Tax=Yersinia artesiana TaxID=2890315 RepID=UPI002A4E25BE|nr:inverse autotransporter beta domain-containing protein [Yersinia artesiana]